VSRALAVTVFHKQLARWLYIEFMSIQKSMLIFHRRQFMSGLFSVACATALWTVSGMARAADEAPDAFIQRITNETLNTIKADPALRGGDIAKIMLLVDSQLMPHVNFQRMTALATGPAWRRATDAQKKRLQEEFKILLVRTYAGGLNQINDQVVVVKPLRPGQPDNNLVVNSDLRGHAGSVQFDYRLEKKPGQGAGWLIFDMNILGVWLIENYRNQFTKEINAGGIDALIASLAARNLSNAKAS
jgi:phospholipid transport system substrate-binding protein